MMTPRQSGVSSRASQQTDKIISKTQRTPAKAEKKEIIADLSNAFDKNKQKEIIDYRSDSSNNKSSNSSFQDFESDSFSMQRKTTGSLNILHQYVGGNIAGAKLSNKEIIKKKSDVPNRKF